MDELKKKEMMAKFIKNAVEFAMDNDMKYFYIGFPDIKDVQLGGLYIARAGNRKFCKEVKHFFGNAYYVKKANWNKKDIVEFLSKELDLPLWMML